MIERRIVDLCTPVAMGAPTSTYAVSPGALVHTDGCVPAVEPWRHDDGQRLPSTRGETVALTPPRRTSGG